jgi:hypothetical protein
MDSTSIELSGSTITGIEIDGETIRVRFEPAYLVKTMTGSVKRTRWWQNGALIFNGASLDDEQPVPGFPAECTGGDVGENIYTYRDMVPVPLESHGHAHCALTFDQGAIRIEGTAVSLELEGVPKYISHLRPD